MTDPYWDPDLDSPEKLVAFARSALKLSRSHAYPPAQPVQPVVVPGTTYVPPTQPVDQRPTGMLMVQQGLLAMQLAEAITHRIEEEP